MAMRLNQCGTMLLRSVVLAVAALFIGSGAQADRPGSGKAAGTMFADREQIRPPLEGLPVPAGYTRDQIVRGDRIFHGEAAGGKCMNCHGVDAKGMPVGTTDLTTGMYTWADGSVAGIKRGIMHNMSIAPGMDGELRPDDVDAVAVYVWALGRRKR
jgi:mono/diheme cytochrome c family protein